MGLNVLFHTVKITMCILWMANVWKRKSTAKYNALVVSDNIWVIGLSVMILITGSRLLIHSNRSHLEAYNTHKTQTLIMMGVLIFCEMSSVYYKLLNQTLVASSDDFRFCAGLTVTFLPAVCFLFTKRTEDCIGCFNKFTSRYSSFQFAIEVTRASSSWDRSNSMGVNDSSLDTILNEKTIEHGNEKSIEFDKAPNKFEYNIYDPSK